MSGATWRVATKFNAVNVADFRVLLAADRLAGLCGVHSGGQLVSLEPLQAYHWIGEGRNVYADVREVADAVR